MNGGKDGEGNWSVCVSRTDARTRPARHKGQSTRVTAIAERYFTME